jgi:hypothetical protein
MGSDRDYRHITARAIAYKDQGTSRAILGLTTDTAERRLERRPSELMESLGEVLDLVYRRNR